MLYLGCPTQPSDKQVTDQDQSSEHTWDSNAENIHATFGGHRKNTNNMAL